MTLGEAIKHAEKVAEKNEKKAKSYPRPNKSVKGSGKKYNACLKCAEEHRQLAEWLKELKAYKYNETNGGLVEALMHSEAENERLHDELKAYKEQSGDVISRQAVLDMMQMRMGGKELYKAVYNLPSVKQEPKTGHWIRISIDKYVQHAMAYYRCSECGKDIIVEYNYCPNCGAKMVESE